MAGTVAPNTALSAMMPARRAIAVTPHDTNELALGVCDSLYIGTGGDVEVLLEDDTSPVIFTNVQDGCVLPLRARRVRDAGTTAQGILALY